MSKIIHTGGCHCGAVRFEVRAPAQVTVQRCNCSICAMTGFEHLIVPAADFKLLSGAEQLSTYSFNTGAAKHLFCRICGIKSFYVPRSNPDGYSVNLRCLA
ncbi:MAG: GFA family protein, partial [Stenotrophobium sp.]